MQWVPLAVTDPDGPPAMEMALHADTMTVRFASSYTRLSTYTGIIDDRAPSGWAVRLAAALEPCWRPTDATPPWRRAIPPLPAKRVTDLPPP